MDFSKRVIHLVSLIVFLGALAPVVGFAGEAGSLAPPFRIFGDVDIDQDGNIDLDEANTYHTRVFAMFDSNKDGSLSSVEFVGQRLGPDALGFCARETYDIKEQRYAAWNVNGDAGLSKAEFLAGTLSCFAKTDRNGDSKLDNAEFNTTRGL